MAAMKTVWEHYDQIIRRGEGEEVEVGEGEEGRMDGAG